MRNGNLISLGITVEIRFLRVGNCNGPKVFAPLAVPYVVPNEGLFREFRMVSLDPLLHEGKERFRLGYYFCRLGVRSHGSLIIIDDISLGMFQRS